MAVPVFVRSIIFTIVVPCTVAGWVPHWLSNSTLDGLMFGKAPSSLITDILGYILLVLGAAIYLWCVYDFTFIGRGTPAVFDPPKELVIRGLYEYVRNPMYIGVIFALAGQVFLYGSPIVLFYTVAIGVFFIAFVLVEEEPALHKKFGNDYDEYSRRVNRWLPKLK